MRKLIPAAFLMAVVAVAPAVAQPVPVDDNVSETAAAAYFALGITPVGALPATITTRLVGGSTGVGYRFQFGHVDESGDFSRRVLGAGIDFPMGRMSLGVTAGFTDYACKDIDDFGIAIELDCKLSLMGGLSLATPLISSAVGTEGSRFDIGLDGTVGYGTGDVLDIRIDDGLTVEELEFAGTGTSVTIGVPLSLTAKSGTMSLIPFLTPRIGWGRATFEITDSNFPDATEKITESGTRFMMGAGVAAVFGNGFGASVGFQKIFIEDGDTTIGFSLSWNR